MTASQKKEQLQHGEDGATQKVLKNIEEGIKKGTRMNIRIDIEYVDSCLCDKDFVKAELLKHGWRIEKWEAGQSFRSSWATIVITEANDDA